MSVNGVAFDRMPFLEQVQLEGNVCIDKEFRSDSIPDNLYRKVSRNCASDDFPRQRVFCNPFADCFNFENFNDTCCFVKTETIIETSSNSFADYLLVKKFYAKLTVLLIHNQRRIEFLPVLVHETFPHLIAYSVDNTPIRSISKKHFEKLHELEILRLEGGLIEAVRSNTFEDLTKLKKISISKITYKSCKNL